MDYCDGTKHYWSDDSYSSGSYDCPGPERCATAKAKAAKEKKASTNKLMAEAKDVKPKKSKAEQARDLTLQAKKLEAEAREDAIRERCTYQGVEWNRKGLAKAVYSEFAPCPGYGGQQHWESYNDEYGSRQSCGQCGGNGTIYVQHYIRVPEYDAPKPPKEPV